MAKKKPSATVQDLANIVGNWAKQPGLSPDEQQARLTLLRALLSRCESRIRLGGGSHEIMRTDIVINEKNIVEAVKDALAGLESHPVGLATDGWARCSYIWPRAYGYWPRSGGSST
jgi:hypothetical protein